MSFITLVDKLGSFCSNKTTRSGYSVEEPSFVKQLIALLRHFILRETDTLLITAELGLSFVDVSSKLVQAISGMHEFFHTTHGILQLLFSRFSYFFNFILLAT